MSWLETFTRKLNDGTAWTEGFTDAELRSGMEYRANELKNICPLTVEEDTALGWVRLWYFNYGSVGCASGRRREADLDYEKTLRDLALGRKRFIYVTDYEGVKRVDHICNWMTDHEGWLNCLRCYGD
jgi:hypothetical protein